MPLKSPPKPGSTSGKEECSEKLETEEPELRGPSTFVELGAPPTAVITSAPCSKPYRVGVTSPAERARQPDPRWLHDTRRRHTGSRARVPAHTCVILPREAASPTAQSQEQKRTQPGDTGRQATPGRGGSTYSTNDTCAPGGGCSSCSHST